MKKLLSLPSNLVECFHQIEDKSPSDWFCTSDPVDKKLGSGGGTTWLLQSCHRAWGGGKDFSEWLSSEKRILLHAGGQSRRLPSYAPSGKILTPIPAFRWARGQRLSQNLLSLQMPLYERIMQDAPNRLNTLIASGDVYIRAGKLPAIPDVDVVCYGLWVSPNLAKNHGVFLSSRQSPERLDCMWQKPSVEKLGGVMHSHLFLMDVGIWLLSDRAVELLIKNSSNQVGELNYYDLYSEFGCALGDHPTILNKEVNALTVAVLPLNEGEFYHYGTSREMISSTLAVQNLVHDQRRVLHYKIKPHPAMFVQNAQTDLALSSQNANLWIENSHLAKTWMLNHDHIITGVPHNQWQVTLAAGVCVDCVPIGRKAQFVVRPYHIDDAFRGELTDERTFYLGIPLVEWLRDHRLAISELGLVSDIQSASLFPVCDSIEEMGNLLRWMINANDYPEGRELWLLARRVSADEIASEANLFRLSEQRCKFQRSTWEAIAKNHEQSIFYQLDLDDAAKAYCQYGLEAPAPLEGNQPILKIASDQMFRAQLKRLRGEPYKLEEEYAFDSLRSGILENSSTYAQSPKLAVYPDQIVWGRSPVRIDLAGGWSDTPPYCLSSGGNVVNLAIELNGQKPLQAYVKPSSDFVIVLRSIDLGAMEVITSYEELANYNQVGSPFSIPKAALALAGFHPQYAVEKYATLEEQLRHFGAGIEITLLAAIPAGSGLGTSSILASTVLAALANFCALNWDKNEICLRTLVLEQLLTTGGGWQDQYGGVLHGVKLLQTSEGFDQTPVTRWMPDTLFVDPTYKPCHLLYYTGITRVAKGILGEIVRGMFLNKQSQLSLLDEMKSHTLTLYEAVLCNDFSAMGRLVGHSWVLNKQLDSGVNPPEVEAIIAQVRDLCLGYKLPGAGGGGYLYMVAKDEQAAQRIRRLLMQNPLNKCGRFVEMSLSHSGLQVSRS